MSRLSIAAMALVLLLTVGCSSQEEMKGLQQKCNGGDQDACEQLRTPPKPLPIPVLPHHAGSPPTIFLSLSVDDRQVKGRPKAVKIDLSSFKPRTVRLRVKADFLL